MSLLPPDLVLTPRPIVVLTDRYPPDAQGGAEISLHATLRAMKRGRDLIVVRFDRAVVSARMETVDGIEVLVLPDQAAYPLQHRSRAEQTRRKAWPRPLKLATDIGGTALSLSGQMPRSGSGTAMAGALLHEISPPRGGVVADDDLTRRGWRLRVLREVLTQLQPKLFHADNLRSILLAAALRGELGGVRVVGLVRDNRFWCTRYDQSGAVNGKPCATCDLACAREDARRFATVHRSILAHSRDVRRQALARMDAIAVTSRHLEAQVRSVAPAAKISWVGNPADALDDVATLIRGVAEYPGFNILTVGRISRNKGQLALIGMREALARAIPGVRLHFAGDADDEVRAELDAVFAASGGAPVIWHGRLERPELYALYRACQIVALPTQWAEPFGRVPIEAGLARRPVVAFAVGGHAETIAHDETGILVQPGDMSAFVAALAELARDPARRLEMGAAGQRCALETFDDGAVARRLEACWAGLAVG